MASHVSVVGDGSRIRKICDDRAECRIELDRTTDASALAARLGTFSVPEILEYTDTSITFHRFHPSMTISDLLVADYAAAVELAGRVASLIVAIQDGLHHDVELDLPVDDLRFGTRSTFVHGDFTPDNLLVFDDQLVVIDWCSSQWIPGHFNRAPDHWDLIWYIQCVYVRDFVGALSATDRDAYCDEVVAQYASLRPDLDLAGLADDAIGLNQYFQKNVLATHSLPSRIRHSPRWRAFRRFWRRYRS